MKDKVVIITGASSGIGLACARAFIRKNAIVVMAARSLDVLEKIALELDPEGKRALPVRADVSVEEDCKALMEKTIRHYGRIDILINNAGLSMRALFEDAEVQVLKRIMDVNFWGTVYCTKYALPHLQKTQGTIVAVSSIAGFHGLPGRSAYSASKFAMHGLMESIRIENIHKKVNVVVVAASFTASNIRKSALDAKGIAQGETPRNEAKLASPERVAKNILRSIRKRKRNRIMSLEGQLMVLFQRIIPFLTDWVIFRKFKREPNSPIK